jgi:undecaprenyl-diphosphatase
MFHCHVMTVTWLDRIDQAGFALPFGLQDGGPGVVFLTRLAEQFVGNPMLKMAPLVLVLLHGWLRPGGSPRQGAGLASAERVVRGVLAIAGALAAGRLLQEVLPMRQRPRFALPDLPFPPTVFSTDLDDWSSMPSDHAMLVAAIVAAIWMGSRPLAILAAAWGLFFICFVRVWFGLHYASDVLVGFGLGLALAGVILRMPLPGLAWRWLEWLDRQQPRLVVLGLFALAWTIGENFQSVRSLLSTLRRAAAADRAGAVALLGTVCVLGLGALLGRIALLRGQGARVRQGD